MDQGHCIVSIEERLKHAFQLHQTGQLNEAEQAYRSILEAKSDNPLALYLLGILADQTGRSDMAITLIERSLAIRPDNAPALASLGELFRRRGQAGDAVEMLRRAVALAPDQAGTHVNLGRALLDLDRFDEAEASLRQAMVLQPHGHEAYFHLGLALIDAGRFSDAELCLSYVIALKPDLVEAYSNLGAAQIALKYLDQAEISLRQATVLSPDLVEAHSNLGCVLNDLGRFEEAEISLRRAAELDGKRPDIHSNLGCVLNFRERFEEGEASLRRAIEMKPDFAEAHGNLGWSLINQKRFEEAEASLRLTIKLDPGLAEAHSNLGHFLLQQGRFAEGWREFDFREKRPTTNIGLRGFEVTGPVWQGERLDGRTLFVCVEQGFGDMIQFLRYLPRAAAMGGKVMLDLPTPLVPLAAHLQGLVELIPFGTSPAEYDFHCQLLDLPGIFATDLDTIPNEVPYLQPPPDRLERWHKELPETGRLRIGVVWAGNPMHSNDKNRSIPLEQFERLFERNDLFFVSLQKIVAEEDLARLQRHPLIRHIGPQLEDYAETAAALTRLDLIIAVDTSVAHLAGALGKRVWVLLPYLPDWRWMLDREDSPWYPTLRLFRQEHPKDWDSVLDRVSTAISEFVGD